MKNVTPIQCDQVKRFDLELTNLPTRTKNDVIKKITGVKSTSVLTRIRNAHYDAERFRANAKFTPSKTRSNGGGISKTAHINGDGHHVLLDSTPERAVIEILDDAFGMDDLTQVSVKLDSAVLNWLGRTSTRLNISQSILLNTVLRYFKARV